MSAVIINKDNFEEEVINSSLPVVVDFWATWCGPCQLQSPELAKFEKANEGKIKIAKINVDDFPELAQRYGVQSIPTLIKFEGGAEVKREVGLQNKEALEANFL